VHALLVSLLLAGSGYALERGTATITTANGAAVVRIEVAATDAERQRGLMGRRSLEAGTGMLFVYPHDVTGGFWMKNTMIPLDIAFISARGRIVRIHSMLPCRVDPCRIYEPRASYRRALEVRGGSFRRWGVRVGDRLTYRLAPR
jgi:uncharacterized membrane protein (UPF0127 family)